MNRLELSDNINARLTIYNIIMMTAMTAQINDYVRILSCVQRTSPLPSPTKCVFDATVFMPLLNSRQAKQIVASSLEWMQRYLTFAFCSAPWCVPPPSSCDYFLFFADAKRNRQAYSIDLTLSLGHLKVKAFFAPPGRGNKWHPLTATNVLLERTCVVSLNVRFLFLLLVCTRGGF